MYNMAIFLETGKENLNFFVNLLLIINSSRIINKMELIIDY